MREPTDQQPHQHSPTRYPTAPLPSAAASALARLERALPPAVKR